MKTLSEYGHDLVKANEEGADDLLSFYDKMVWALCSASKEEIDSFIEELYTDPLIQLPVPIQVMAFRLLGLEYVDSAEHRQTARAGIATYCDPITVDTVCKSFSE